MHSIKNILGKDCLQDEEEPQKTLSGTESNLLFALSKALTLTNFQGNDSPVPTNINPHVKILPKLKITKGELMDLMNVSRNQRNKTENVMKALETLSKVKWKFEYNRLCYGKDGSPLKTLNGNWSMDTVETNEKLFSVKFVKNEDKSRLKYIEVIPATIFIDQIDTYYLAIPNDLIDQINKISSGKRISSTVRYMFLYFCKKMEDERRRKTKKSNRFSIHWKNLAKVVRISNLSINKKRGFTIRKLIESIEFSQMAGLVKTWSFSDEEFSFQLSEKPPLDILNISISPDLPLQEIEERIENIPDKPDEDIAMKNFLMGWKFRDGKNIKKHVLKRWLLKKSPKQIYLNIGIYEKNSHKISDGKHEAYLESLIFNEAGTKFENEKINFRMAKDFKTEKNWSDLEIKKNYVSIRRGGDRETVSFTINPASFKKTLLHLYKSFRNLE